MKRALQSALILSFLVALPASAQMTIARSVVGSGGSAITGANHRIHGTVGQQAIGLLSEGAHLVGFWYVASHVTDVPSTDPPSVHDVGDYSLLATHSMILRSRSHVQGGHVGVNTRGGRKPFLGNKVELQIGTYAVTEEAVEVSAPNVSVKNRAQVKGTLHYFDKLDVHQRAVVADPVQEEGDFWPLVDLPEFKMAEPGEVNIDVRTRREMTISPTDGPFNKIKVRNKATLIFTGGEYHIGNLDVGNEATVIFEAPTTLLIADKLATANKSKFGPRPDSGVEASDILVYVRGYNGKHKTKIKSEKKKSKKKSRKSQPAVELVDDWAAMEREIARRMRSNPKAVKVGNQAVFRANVYAPNGTVDLTNRSQSTGAFIARYVDVGVQAKVQLNNGWEGFNPAALAKPVFAKAAVEHLAQPGDFGLDQNFPNPFNPTTAIRYQLAEMADVQLTVYNMLGQQVQVLVQHAQPAGVHLVEWDGRNASGQLAGSGIYFYRLIAGDQRAVRKMTLAR